MKDENQLTRVLSRVSERFIRVDALFKEKGKMPYGQVKATPKEQREEFNKLTPEKVAELIQTYGPEAVNEYIKKMIGGK